MGTRHLVAVCLDGAFKIAQYGQWDGYPTGQGVTVLDFLSKMDKDRFIAKVRASKFLTEEEIEKTWAECGAPAKAEFIPVAISSLHKEKYPALSRDTGGDILEMVNKADDGIGLMDSHKFAADSLYCEFAYVVDLDKDTFEVYKGFNKDPIKHNERFGSLSSGEQKYYPVKLWKEWKLDKLPSEDEFLKELTEDDEDDE